MTIMADNDDGRIYDTYDDDYACMLLFVPVGYL